MIRRYFVDCLTNYLFFVPLVIAFTPQLWSLAGAVQYMVAAVPITLLGATVYSRLLMKAYDLFNIKMPAPEPKWPPAPPHWRQDGHNHPMNKGCSPVTCPASPYYL